MTCLPWLASLDLRGKVVLVAGPPLSGKTTLAHAHALPGDEFVDFDYVHSALTGLPLYQRDPSLIQATMYEFNRRAKMLTQGWIVQTAARQAIRAYAHARKARTIVLEVSPGVCMSRLTQRPPAVRTELRAAINTWWANYQRDVYAQQRGDESVLPRSQQWRIA